MPIPTDTFRNIRRLNWIFAATAVLLFLLMAASVAQDFFKSWREPQRNANVWEAALVKDKLDRSLTPEKKKRLDELSAEIEAQKKGIDAHRGEVDRIKGQVARIRSQISTLEFSLNNLKATVAVQEAGLEQARTAAATPEQKEQVARMERELREPRANVAKDTEQIKNWEVEIARLNEDLGKRVGALADLEKQKTKLEAEDAALRKKREALQPRSPIAKLSTIIRRTPLMQFINPAERVTQDVLPDVRTDVAFQKITTIDRCRTCHVNIEDKQFREGDVLAFLERGVAEDRGLKLPGNRPARVTDPQATIDQPGAAAMAEFWHAWGLELSPPAVRRNAARIKSVGDTVGKGVTVTVNGQALPAFAYDLNLALTRTDAPAADRQDKILVQLLRAWAAFEPKGADKSAVAVSADSNAGNNNANGAPSVKVEITNGAANAAAVRAAALKYPEDVRAGLESSLEKDERRILLDRYRRHLTAALNVARDKRGEPALDDGRVMLAHPNLDLYVGVDSKHSFEKVGCTSCHDGSGQETDFVLAAHTPRAMWVDQRTGAPVLPEQVVDKPAGHHRATLASMLEAVYPEGALAPMNASSLTMPIARAHGAASGHDAHAGPGQDGGAGHAAVVAGGAGETASGTRAAASTAVLTDAAGGGSHAHISDDAAPVTYRDPVTGRTARAVPQMQYWAKKYELESGDSFGTVHHRWDWPMRPPQFLEANCVRCHTQAADIRDFAPTLNEGRALFTNLGCVNCHQMDSIPAEQKRQVGTDLRHVTEKLSPAFINTWVWAPKAFRPSTKMPHFFLLENNSGDEEIRRTRQEARAITEYLVRTATPSGPRPQLAPAAKGSADAGRQLFETVGCLGCHVNLNAPAKTGGGTVAQQWITTDLIKNGELAERLEPVVASATAERLARDLEKTVEATLVKSTTDSVTAAVRKELTPKAPTGAAARTAPRPTPAEKAELEARIKAEAEKRLPAALEQARKGLPAAVETARKNLPATIASTTATELAARVKAEAQKIYDEMSYNERQLYLAEKLEPPSILLEQDPSIPWRNEPPKDPSIFTVRTYPDGTPKPVFMHHGPELSGIGTKLAAGRTPEQARGWLFAWLKEPHHYSSYTLMPNLRLTDQQALDLTEYLLGQTREKNKPGDEWTAELTPEDPAKLSELMSLFLRSRFSVKTADAKAVEENDPTQPNGYGEVTKLAIEALTTPATPRAEAEAQVKKMTLAQKQMAWLGKKLVAHYGCMSCHQINGMETATSPCANLSDWGQKAVTKLDFAYLDHHKHVGPDALPETFTVNLLNGLSEQAVKLAHGAGAGAGAAGVGAGTGGAAAPAAGSAAATKGDARPANPHSDVVKSDAVAVGWPHVGHSREEWITQKLGNTRIYDRGKNLLEPSGPRNESGRLENPGRPYDKLRMPTFYLNQQQVHAIVTFVISNRDRLITETLTQKAMSEEAQRVAFGRFLTQRYNCVSCHQVERNAAPVQQYYAREDVVTKAPPSLRGEGNKIRHDWLFNFLRNVEPLRPLPQIRMPSFHFANDAEVTAIAAYFASLSNRESKELKRNIDLVLAHVEGPKKAAGAGGSATPASGVAPATQPGVATTQPSKALGAPTGSALTQNAAPQSGAAPAGTPASAGVSSTARKPWFLEESLEAPRRFLEDWAINNKQLTLTQIDPARNPKPEDLAKGYDTLLFKARFTSELYDAPYPFADAATPRVSQERFKKGEALFHEMQCLKCHMFGEVRPDEKVPSSVVAPNLSLAHQRLQRRWVRHWVQEPPIIQVGTAMPPFLSGLAALKLDGLSWPRSQMLPEPEVQRIESAYGVSPDEQAGLLLDFLYAAGARNYTPAQPAGGADAGASPAPLPQGAPPTAQRPASAGDPTVGGPSNAPVDKAPVQPGTNVVPPEKKQEMQNPQRPTGAPGSAKTGSPEVTAAGSPAPAPSASPSVPTQPAPAPAPNPDPVPNPSPAPAGNPSITGKVTFKGEAPEPEQIDMSGVKECAAHHPDGAFAERLVVNGNGTLKNVLVRVTAGLPEGKQFPAPSTPARLDQKGCQYYPHVVGVMVGQPMVISNSDAFLHNVHALSNENPAFNFGQPNKDAGRPIDPLKTPEAFKVKCDVHPWMGAFVHVLDHPFFSVTGDDGAFAITGLPPGNYTVTAWHETLGEQQQANVNVEQGKPAAVEFSFEAK